jgi:hypothetical protein
MTNRVPTPDELKIIDESMKTLAIKKETKLAVTKRTRAAKKEKKPRVQSDWVKYLKQYRIEHPDLSYKECMKLASPSYNAKKIANESTEPSAPPDAPPSTPEPTPPKVIKAEPLLPIDL